MRLGRFRFTLAAAAVGLVGVSAAPVQAGDTLRLHGSTTVTNAIIKPHKAAIAHRSGLTLKVFPNGSHRGLRDLVQGRAAAAMISAPLKVVAGALNKEAPGTVKIDGYTAHRVAAQRVTFVVHRGNPVTSLDRAALRRVLTGEVSRWSAVGGADVPIRIVTETPGGGVRALTESKLLDGGTIRGAVTTIGNAAQIPGEVARHPNTIGLVSQAHTLAPDTKRVKLNEPIRQPLFIVTSQPPSAKVQRLLDAVAAVAGGGA